MIFLPFLAYNSVIYATWNEDLTLIWRTKQKLTEDEEYPQQIHPSKHYIDSQHNGDSPATELYCSHSSQIAHQTVASLESSSQQHNYRVSQKKKCHTVLDDFLWSTWQEWVVLYNSSQTTHQNNSSTGKTRKEQHTWRYCLGLNLSHFLLAIQLFKPCLLRGMLYSILFFEFYARNILICTIWKGTTSAFANVNFKRRNNNGVFGLSQNVIWQFWQCFIQCSYVVTLQRAEHTCRPHIHVGQPEMAGLHTSNSKIS